MGERVLGFAEHQMDAAPAGGWMGGSPADCNYDLGEKCMKTKRKDTSDALWWVVTGINTD
jgi:hypothetical protein